MSERGVFAVDRGFFTNPLFAKEPFTEREAFLWMVAEASWKDRTFRSGSVVVDLKRGQLCHSVRFMAEAWQWSKSRVDRFLGRLEIRDTIVRQSGTAITVVTLCNYNEYQKVGTPERDSESVDCGTAAGQQRDSSGTAAGQTRNIKTLKTYTESEAEIRKVFREAFWPNYPKRKGSNPPDPAETAYVRAIRNGATHEEIAQGLAGHTAECRSSEILGTKFVPQAATWLNQGRWKEHLKAATASAASPGDNSGDAYLRRLSPERWRSYVQDWKRTGGRWDLADRTRPPDHPDTKVPAEILAEIGIVHGKPPPPPPRQGHLSIVA